MTLTKGQIVTVSQDFLLDSMGLPVADVDIVAITQTAEEHDRKMFAFHLRGDALPDPEE